MTNLGKIPITQRNFIKPFMWFSFLLSSFIIFGAKNQSQPQNHLKNLKKTSPTLPYKTFDISFCQTLETFQQQGSLDSDGFHIPLFK